jgi:hypothetical protein
LIDMPKTSDTPHTSHITTSPRDKIRIARAELSPPLTPRNCPLNISREYSKEYSLENSECSLL